MASHGIARATAGARASQVLASRRTPAELPADDGDKTIVYARQSLDYLPISSAPSMQP